MVKIRSYLGVVLAALLASTSTARGSRMLGASDNAHTADKCIVLVSEEIAGIEGYAVQATHVKDGDVLYERWQEGDGVRAINYCIDENLDRIRSLQVVAGKGSDPNDWYRLKKHGHSGGTCRRWTLLPDDYIRRV